FPCLPCKPKCINFKVKRYDGVLTERMLLFLELLYDKQPANKFHLSTWTVLTKSKERSASLDH
ncbi:MAG: hypothetical protein PUP92_16910, partial [Rhizonema sp. PD38]|nr:hypothetical protein [Rhizonema sp. PD38]